MRGGVGPQHAGASTVELDVDAPQRLDLVPTPLPTPAAVDLVPSPIVDLVPLPDR